MTAAPATVSVSAVAADDEGAPEVDGSFSLKLFKAERDEKAKAYIQIRLNEVSSPICDTLV